MHIPQCIIVAHSTHGVWIDVYELSTWYSDGAYQQGGREPLISNGVPGTTRVVGGLFYVEADLADENLRFARKGIESEQALRLPIRAVQLKRVSANPISASGGAGPTTRGTAGKRSDRTAGAGVCSTGRSSFVVAIGDQRGAS